jgi:hypothetical protein
MGDSTGGKCSTSGSTGGDSECSICDSTAGGCSTGSSTGGECSTSGSTGGECSIGDSTGVECSIGDSTGAECSIRGSTGVGGCCLRRRLCFPFAFEAFVLVLFVFDFETIVAIPLLVDCRTDFRGGKLSSSGVGFSMFAVAARRVMGIEGKFEQEFEVTQV